MTAIRSFETSVNTIPGNRCVRLNLQLFYRSFILFLHFTHLEFCSRLKPITTSVTEHMTVNSTQHAVFLKTTDINFPFLSVLIGNIDPCRRPLLHHSLTVMNFVNVPIHRHIQDYSK